MRRTRTSALILAVVVAAGLPLASAAQSPSEAEDQVMIIKHRIEQARKELDEAARKLGSLHSQMWQLETMGSRAKQPMLGIVIDDSGANEGGIDLVGLSPGGGAEQAGLQAGDRLVMINGVRLDAGGDRKPLHLFSEAMSTVQAGDAVPVEYVRDGQALRAEIVTRERGQYMARVVDEQSEWLEGLQALARLESLPALKGLEQLDALEDADFDIDGTVVRVPAGLRLEDVAGELAGYFDVEQGVLVLAAPKRDEALKAGDVLLEVGGEPVQGADAVLERLGKLKGSVPATVKRRGRVHEIALDADALNADQALQVNAGDRRIRIQREGGAGQVQMDIGVED
jgi:S1-C subfamily serine protease